MRLVISRVVAGLVLTLSLGVFAGTQARATIIDLTTFHTSYNNGAGFVPGVPPGWTEAKLPDLISISNGSTLGDGPHNTLGLGPDNFVTATVSASAIANGFTGTFGGFFIDTSNGFFGLGFGTGSISEQYRFNGDPSQHFSILTNYSGPLFLRLERSGGLFEAFYSTDDSNFTFLYSQAGLTGTSQLDLTSFGGASDLTTDFSNLDVVASVPEPGTWMMFIVGLVALGSKMLTRRNVSS